MPVRVGAARRGAFMIVVIRIIRATRAAAASSVGNAFPLPSARAAIKYLARDTSSSGTGRLSEAALLTPEKASTMMARAKLTMEIVMSIA